MPAVLQRPAPLRPLADPEQSLEMTVRRGLDRLLPQLPTVRVSGHKRVGALVRVAPDGHHGLVSCFGGDADRSGTHLGGGGAALLSSHTGRSLSCPGAAVPPQATGRRGLGPRIL